MDINGPDARSMSFGLTRILTMAYITLSLLTHSQDSPKMAVIQVPLQVCTIRATVT